MSGGSIIFLLIKDVEKDEMCDGFTALMLACCVSEREIVPLLEILIRWGANVHARDAQGHSALHVAAVCNQAGAAVDVLIQAGADIEQKDDDGRVAVKYGCVKSYLALLRHGASIDAKDNDGRTPMNIACFEVVVDELLKWGADETIADDEGNTPTSSLDLDSVGYILGEEYSQDEVDRVRLLLQNAPADWLVMLRERVSRQGASCKVARLDGGDTTEEDEAFRGAVGWLGETVQFL